MNHACLCRNPNLNPSLNPKGLATHFIQTQATSFSIPARLLRVYIYYTVTSTTQSHLS